MVRMTPVEMYNKSRSQPMRLPGSAPAYPPLPHMQQRFAPPGMYEASHVMIESYPPGLPAPPRLQPIPSRHLSQSSHSKL